MFASEVVDELTVLRVRDEEPASLSMPQTAPT
jgi:hypothetical protein